MSTKIIPSKEIIVCNRCHKEGERYKLGPFQFGGLHIRNAESWATGMGGDVGGCSVNYDFCSACVEAFNSWVQNEDKKN